MAEKVPEMDLRIVFSVQNLNNRTKGSTGRFTDMMSRKGFSTLVFTLILAFNAFPVYGQSPYTPSELSFTVYADGYAAVDYSAYVDPTRPRVNVTLFGSLYIDILVEDQDGLLLDSSPSEGGLCIDTLGSISVLVSYFTQDLTSKSGQIWAFAVNAPVDVSIILPEGSTIVSLSSVPLSMSNLGENLTALNLATSREDKEILARYSLAECLRSGNTTVVEIGMVSAIGEEKTVEMISARRGDEAPDSPM